MSLHACILLHRNCCFSHPAVLRTRKGPPTLARQPTPPRLASGQLDSAKPSLAPCLHARSPLHSLGVPEDGNVIAGVEEVELLYGRYRGGRTANSPRPAETEGTRLALHERFREARRCRQGSLMLYGRSRARPRARGAMLSRADPLAHTHKLLPSLCKLDLLSALQASRHRFNPIPAFLRAVRAAAPSGRGWRGAAAHVEGAVTASAKSAWRLCLLGRPARRKRHTSSHTASVPWKRKAEGVILARAPTSPTHAAIRICCRRACHSLQR